MSPARASAEAVERRIYQELADAHAARVASRPKPSDEEVAAQRRARAVATAAPEVEPLWY